MILSPWAVFRKLFCKIVFYVLTTLACKKTSKKPPKIHAKCMKKTIKRTYCFARTYFSHLGLNLEGLGTLKWEPKSHIWRPKLKKRQKKLIFGRPFYDFWISIPSGLKRSPGAPQSRFLDPWRSILMTLGVELAGFLLSTSVC